MNKSDEDTVVDVANVEWGVYKMHHLITELTTSPLSDCEKKEGSPKSYNLRWLSRQRGLCSII